ncbi:hypothetical protein HK097_009292 [Rhizophlyctis rosea]|uniref:AA9 family lytic polysaccharide monooxygenase n=1 Tax=Rhizophlyctis rosea TaxID=64517 RepID=A0AAD5X174_9FUNG|nr:hypothetical protein HK097_009292 [Rhizophlyctis rosea]
MKFATAAAILGFAASVSAHSTIYNVFINGVDQGLGCGVDANGKQTGGPSNSKYIRCPPNNNPVKDLTSSAVACNVNNAEAPQWLQVKGTDAITFEWHHDSATSADDIIASSHKGPVVVYIAPASSNGSGPVWVKIYEDGGSPSSWGVDKLIAARGRHYINLPNLAPGKYLIRPELITLHEADTAYSSNPARGVQLYPNCIQIEVSGSGSNTLPSGVAFPGTYTYADKGLVYNLYSPAGAYVIPGPAVWSSARGGGYGIGNGSGGQPQPTTTTTVRTTTTTRVGGSGAALYGQCGGRNWTGPTTCAQGTCKFSNDYYSQCLP